MADFTTPQPLQALLIDATQPPWLNEKDEAAASWDDASLADRQSVAAWVRTWSEGDEIARVKEVMVGVDARIEAAFSVEAAAKFRRWAAGVLLDGDFDAWDDGHLAQGAARLGRVRVGRRASVRGTALFEECRRVSGGEQRFTTFKWSYSRHARRH